jgi:hypothetical protein
MAATKVRTEPESAGATTFWLRRLIKGRRKP